eukprot:359083-Chlamydomonas_euryale.AAC.1
MTSTSCAAKPQSLQGAPLARPRPGSAALFGNRLHTRTGCTTLATPVTVSAKSCHTSNVLGLLKSQGRKVVLPRLPVQGTFCHHCSNLWPRDQFSAASHPEKIPTGGASTGAFLVAAAYCRAVHPRKMFKSPAAHMFSARQPSSPATHTSQPASPPHPPASLIPSLYVRTSPSCLTLPLSRPPLFAGHAGIKSLGPRPGQAADSRRRWREVAGEARLLGAASGRWLPQAEGAVAVRGGLLPQQGGAAVGSGRAGQGSGDWLPQASRGGG